MDGHGPWEAEGALQLAGQRLALLDSARVYACGITPYDVTHLGHATTFVWVDMLGRALRLLGIEPDICRNVTDVDDVLDDAAARAGTDAEWFAAVGQFQFDTEMNQLNLRSPQHEPRAHRYIPHVVRLARHLLHSGSAYAREGSVYFKGGQVPARAGIDHDRALELAAEYGGRPDDPAKDHPLDVAVWQACGPDRVGWQSPWGRGRPGWHAECVAMSASVFGPAVDVHGGGADLAFPHHAYHAVMAEALTGVAPYARAWFHVGTVTVEGEKMAKSAGNLVLVSDLLAEHPAAAIRMMILDRPWHTCWDYSPELLDTAGARLEELYRAAGRSSGSAAAQQRVRQALAADLDVPTALDIAVDSGGDAARTLVTVLGLT
ncbi:class I tRNA ligase family protein [Haloechinothrix sp. LS1_15]|uniref:class I tRNA ligase family protein n=1 Tax=Haloechinothrix sp. LS1_15 TaxID=2652248 RepID=UPI002947582F|nr:class I tRNA ligase family protein [Haloechinothrix sp. LS1_15]MDV6011869.1 class I tRNA ligase family protein [Haloechinothrix sp. LS1_15]